MSDMETYTIHITMDATDVEDFIGAIRQMKDRELREHIMVKMGVRWGEVNTWE